jgi:hypothetical protein
MGPVETITSRRALTVRSAPPRWYSTLSAYAEIGPLHRRSQIGVRGAASTPSADGHVEAADALLLIAIDVLRVGIASLLTRFQPGLMQWIRQQTIACLQWAARAAVGIAAVNVRFSATKVWQHVCV